MKKTARAEVGERTASEADLLGAAKSAVENATFMFLNMELTLIEAGIRDDNGKGGGGIIPEIEFVRGFSCSFSESWLPEFTVLVTVGGGIKLGPESKCAALKLIVRRELDSTLCKDDGTRVFGGAYIFEEEIRQSTTVRISKSYIALNLPPPTDQSNSDKTYISSCLFSSQ